MMNLIDLREHVVDPFERGKIIEWLEREGFKDYSGLGYWEKCYSLNYSYPVMRVGMPEGQLCATIALSDASTTDAVHQDRRTVYLGEAYTVPVIAALWAVLNLFDFDESRSHAYWRDYHERRYPMPAKKE